MMSDAPIPWRQEDDRCFLTCGPLAGELEFQALGVHFLAKTWNGQKADQFGVLSTTGPQSSTLRMEIVERYIRGTDLVANYAQTPPHQFAPQIYWRAESLPPFCAVKVEMIISMQTELLDSDPVVSVHSFGLLSDIFQADRLVVDRFEKIVTPQGATSPETAFHSVDRSNSDTRLFVFRCPSLGLSYSQMIHPSDFVSAEVFCDHNLIPFLVNSRIFPERLEKGVIRRARICGWFLPAENDLATAVELAKRFVDGPLPLTT